MKKYYLLVNKEKARQFAKLVNLDSSEVLIFIKVSNTITHQPVGTVGINNELFKVK